MGRWATDRGELVAPWPSRKSLLANDANTDDPVGNAHLLPTNATALQTPNPEPSSFRINWEIKALAWIACAPLVVMLLFLLAAFFWHKVEHTALLVSGTGTFAICCTLFVMLALRVQQQLRESHIEIDHIRSQMTQPDHIETLGKFAPGLAHAIRNPLAGIAGVVEIISRDLPATSPARAMVKEIRREIARINHTVSDLLQMAEPHPPKMRKSDLNTTVEHAVMLGRQRALGKSVEIALQKDPHLPEVEHDSDQIHHVLLNLLLNALQAIDSKGKVTVALKAQGTTAVIEVTDDGHGIAPEDLPNIFRPFCASRGQTTGMGLSLARRIVESHHGHIDVISAAGRGTTFAVILPVCQAIASGAA
jgi:signal transduction histidine kinase